MACVFSLFDLNSGWLLFTKRSSNWSKDCLFFPWQRGREREYAHDSNHLRSDIVLLYIVSQFRIALEHIHPIFTYTFVPFDSSYCISFYFHSVLWIFIYSNFQKPMPNNRLLIRSFTLATCYIIQFLLLFLLRFFLSLAQDTHTHTLTIICYFTISIFLCFFLLKFVGRFLLLLLLSFWMLLYYLLWLCACVYI